MDEKENTQQQQPKKKTSSLPGVLFTIIILLIIAALVAPPFIDKAIKAAIEKAGSKQLGVAVTVEKTHLNIISGAISIDGIKIANPEGYQYDHLLKVGQIAVKANVKSIFSDTVEIEQIDLKQTDVVIEQKGLSSNLNDILKSMPKSEKAKTETEDKPAETEKSKNVYVASVDITDVNVTAKLLPIPGKNDSIKLKIDKIHLSDIGSKEKATVPELVGKIINAIASAIAKQGTDVLPKELTGALGDSVEAISKQTEELLKATDNIGKEVEKTTEALKGLFKSKDE